MNQRSITFQQYRAADLTLFLIITVAAELCIGLAAAKWFPEQPYTVTLIYAMTALVAMRWGGYSVMIAVADSIAYCMACGGTPKQFVIYTVGGCFAVLVLLLNKFLGKKRIANSASLSTLYVLVIFLSAVLGRGLMSVLYGSSADVIVRLASTDALSAAFAVLVVLICRRQNGMFEDQREYLLRLEREKRERNGDGPSYQPTPEEMQKKRENEENELN